MVFISTEGDRRTNEPLADIGGKGLFLKELEEALLDEKIDFAVHSLKDVPTALPSGLTLAAYSAREDPRDAWISRDRKTLKNIPPGARVGTGSLRRSALLAEARPDLSIIPIRGNVDTRLRKVVNGELDAIVLASAGLQRLGRLDEATELLDSSAFLPAPGQGILGFECPIERRDVQQVLGSIGSPESEWSARAERTVLALVGGDCRTPLGAFATRDRGTARLDAFFRSPGSNTNRRAGEAARDGDSPESLAERVAAALLSPAGS